MTILAKENQSKLMQTIAALVHEKTFTAEAIEGIKLLRDECAKLESECLEKTARIQKLDADFAAVVRERDEARLRCSAWAKRETDLLAREAKITELEKTAAVASGKLEAFSDAFHTIFKNTVVREGITGSIPIATGNPPYPTTQPLSEFRTRERE